MAARVIQQDRTREFILSCFRVSALDIQEKLAPSVFKVLSIAHLVQTVWMLEHRSLSSSLHLQQRRSEPLWSGGVPPRKVSSPLIVFKGKKSTFGILLFFCLLLSLVYCVCLLSLQKRLFLWLHGSGEEDRASLLLAASSLWVPPTQNPSFWSISPHVHCGREWQQWHQWCDE